MPDGTYTEKMPDFGELMTVAEFRRAVKDGAFIDYDGYGNAAKLIVDPKDINPSEVKNPDHIPDDATHIVWYNK